MVAGLAHLGVQLAFQVRLVPLVFPMTTNRRALRTHVTSAMSKAVRLEGARGVGRQRPAVQHRVASYMCPAADGAV